MSLVGNGKPLIVFEDGRFESELGDKGILLQSSSRWLELIKRLLKSWSKFSSVPEVGLLFLKGQIVNILGLQATWSLSQLLNSHLSTKVVTDNIYTSRYGCVPIKLYVQKRDLANHWCIPVLPNRNKMCAIHVILKFIVTTF